MLHPSTRYGGSEYCKKAHDSRYVFDGVITEITSTYIRVKVAQYFKGVGSSVVKIAHSKKQANTCADQLVVNQQALFLPRVICKGFLKLFYDGTFGSARTMNTDNFSKITAATACMATYENGSLAVPCLIHEETQKFYQATLDPANSADGLKFSVADVDEFVNEVTTITVSR